MPKPLRIVFAGTPIFASEILTALVNSEHDIIAVYTQPDRKAGRGKKLTSSPVKQNALRQKIMVLQPESLRQNEQQSILKNLKADIMVVAAYGILLPQSILDTPTFGCINVHASLLPRWRGAAPIERALLAGDTETGVTIMQMDKGLDTGDILSKRKVSICDTMTSAELHDLLIPAGISSLLDTLSMVACGTVKPEKQDDLLASYAKKLVKAEGSIDWSQHSRQVCRLIRGLSPKPVSFTCLDTTVIRIWNATAVEPLTDKINSTVCGTIISTAKEGVLVSCGSNSLLLIQSLQLPGGNRLSSSDVFNSKQDMFTPGRCFYSPNSKDHL